MIGNGKYWVQNKKTKEGIDITITFSGNQQYKFQTEDKYLKSQDTNWELVREYDHLYIKNVNYCFVFTKLTQSNNSHFITKHII